jgi:hypothetical protein
MHHLLPLVLAFLIPAVSAARNETFLEEALYHEYRSQALDDAAVPGGALVPAAQKLHVDAVWDLVEEGYQEALRSVDDDATFYYTLFERLRIGLLRLRAGGASNLDPVLAAEVAGLLRSPEPEARMVYLVAGDEELLRRAGHGDLVDLARAHGTAFAAVTKRPKALSPTLVTDLFWNAPAPENWRDGAYARAVRLYMFCREDRRYPCLFALRNAAGEAVRNPDGTLWTQPALGSSKHGFPSHQRNGDTPAGVLTMDSVMPAADQPETFGRFRRVILNFVPASADEGLLKAVLPPSSRSEGWWRPAVIARDVGRNLLRIHGTGKLNSDPATPFFPFLQTLGCVAQLENTYGAVTYRDQQNLLDVVLRALALAPTFENEPRIKGLLYLVELDNKTAPVTPTDLAERGIR